MGFYKLGLMICNIAIVAGGAVYIGIGAFLIGKYGTAIMELAYDNQPGAWLIAIGVLTFIPPSVSSVAIILKKDEVWLKCALGLVVLLAVAQIFLGSFAFYNYKHRQRIGQEKAGKLADLIAKDTSTIALFDHMHRKAKCCGGHGKVDYSIFSTFDSSAALEWVKWFLPWLDSLTDAIEKWLAEVKLGSPPSCGAYKEIGCGRRIQEAIKFAGLFIGGAAMLTCLFLALSGTCLYFLIKGMDIEHGQPGAEIVEEQVEVVDEEVEG